MKHNRSFQDQYQRPDDQGPDDDEKGLDQIQARFERLARKVRDDSGAGQTKFIRPASHPDAPVFAQSRQGLLPALATNG